MKPKRVRPTEMTSDMDYRYLNRSGASRLFGGDGYAMEGLPVRVVWVPKEALRDARINENIQMCDAVFEAESGRFIGGYLSEGVTETAPDDLIRNAKYNFLGRLAAKADKT